jgi:hypothetical protein
MEIVNQGMRVELEKMAMLIATLNQKIDALDDRIDTLENLNIMHSKTSLSILDKERK